MTPLQSIKELISQMQTSIIGQQNVIERMVLTLLAEGNLLLEGLPGLAKTPAIICMAKSMDATKTDSFVFKFGFAFGNFRIKP